MLGFCSSSLLNKFTFEQIILLLTQLDKEIQANQDIFMHINIFTHQDDGFEVYLERYPR